MWSISWIAELCFLFGGHNLKVHDHTGRGGLVRWRYKGAGLEVPRGLGGHPTVRQINMVRVGHVRPLQFLFASICVHLRLEFFSPVMELSRRGTCVPPSNLYGDQNVSLSPTWMSRPPPEPTSGLPVATSGVAHPQPNEVPLDKSMPCLTPACEPQGLATRG
jgi:hypothetical protein